MKKTKPQATVQTAWKLSKIPITAGTELVTYYYHLFPTLGTALAWSV